MAADISHHPAPAAAPVGPPERQQHKGRKPFSSLMKRLASLKNHTATAHTRTSGRAASCPDPSPYAPYYPYKPGDKPPAPPSSSASAIAPSHISFGPTPTSSHSTSSRSTSSQKAPSEKSRHPPPSATTTTTTTTTTTSTFSSPTPSVRSLTTTLTTIQSTAPGSLLDPYYNPHPHHHHNPNAPPTLFHHQFPSTPNPPISPPPASLHPLNYSTATAGGLLTDNASIITLASSSKRRRRHSLDTDASVRALAPSSLWGGSRESLPLSVLSGFGERGSVYGASFRGDAGSMVGVSIMGELAGGVTIAGNRDSVGFSRRSSAWVDEKEEDEEEDGSTIERRRSLCGEEGGEGQSMRDGSSNVGVWHGVFGHKEGEEGEKYGEGERGEERGEGKYEKGEVEK